MKRVPITLNIALETREALDRKVAEGRAKGFPVERASLAAHMLSVAASGLSVDAEAVADVAVKLGAMVERLRAEPAPMKADRIKSMADALASLEAGLLVAIGEEASDG